MIVRFLQAVYAKPTRDFIFDRRFVWGGSHRENNVVVHAPDQGHPEVLGISSLIGIGYRPGSHSLLTLLHAGLSGSSPVLVTGSPYRCTSLSPPHTLSDVRVREGPSRPVGGSTMTMDLGS
jgi:hypothetical protein